MATAREQSISPLENYAILKCQKKILNKETKPHPLPNRHSQKKTSPVLPEAGHELDSPVTIQTTFWLEGYLNAFRILTEILRHT